MQGRPQNLVNLLQQTKYFPIVQPIMIFINTNQEQLQLIFIQFSELRLSLIKFFSSLNWPNSPAKTSSVELTGPQRGECVRSVSDLYLVIHQIVLIKHF